MTDGRAVDARARSVLFWNHRLSHMMCMSHTEVIHIVEPPYLVPHPIISFVRISRIRQKSRYISVVQFKSLVS